MATEKSALLSVIDRLVRRFLRDFRHLRLRYSRKRLIWARLHAEGGPLE